MHYLTEADKSKPLTILEDLVTLAPIAIHGSKGNDLVVMTLADYERMADARLKAFKKSWHELSEEARKNGLTAEKLEQILADVS